MTIQLRLAAVTAALALFFVSPAGAQGAKPGKEGKSGVAVAHADALVLTSDSELKIIREYYVAVGRKPKPLPPGIAKNLARGKRVPPGLMRSRLPDDLIVRLPRRDGYEWAVANDVVILIDATGIVRDILRNVF
ncbi:MAG TPA: anti-virulence regulator CigR family protein [Gemmatimonadaceae bacterium]|nr:anti-virulence regulator CigR family protein [Gemmatimonadaceae bacterium]